MEKMAYLVTKEIEITPGKGIEYRCYVREDGSTLEKFSWEVTLQQFAFSAVSKLKETLEQC